MGFSTQIKEQALLSSARRCCVCKKITGRNIEVHHIIPESENGANTLENAIPLCFDCHADAGHYNPKHPRGIKFSREELRKHRDLWYEVVAKGLISLDSISLTQQFFITDSVEIICEITKGDFSNFPINHVKLLQNELFKYLKIFNYFHKNALNSDTYKENYYSSLDEYLRSFPEAKKEISEWDYISYERNPSKEELESKFLKEEFIVNYMLKYNAKPDQIAKVIFSEVGCGDGNFETYYLRKFKVIFLSLINNKDETIHLRSILREYADDLGFKPLNECVNADDEISLNNLVLEPGECLVIPYCIILTPIYEDFLDSETVICEQIASGESQFVTETTLNQKNEIITIGTREIIKEISIEAEGFSHKIKIKPLILENLLMISRSWECGSCPHIFVKRHKSNNWEYLTELFNNSPSTRQKFSIDLTKKPFSDIELLKVVELEDEITKIDIINSNQGVITTELVLLKGQDYTIKTYELEMLLIEGMYLLHENVNYSNLQHLKIMKIALKLSNLNKNCHQ